MKYVIGNWKSNQNITESLLWLDSLKAICPRFPANLTVVLCLPFTDLAAFNQKLAETNLPIVIGSQNVSPFPPGKHTGEITASMLSELVSYCLVGHSERRRDFGESSDTVATKAALLLENTITPIVCLDTPYLDEQIKSLYQHNVDVSRCFFVYEPKAAIGSGSPADPNSAGHVANQISFLLDNSAPVLYGGSVSSDNAASFLKQTHISGVLVGAESLEAQLFVDIINVVGI